MLQATHNSDDALVAYQYLERRVLFLPDNHHAKRIQCICTPHWHWIPEVKSHDGSPPDGSHSSAWARLIILFNVVSQFVQANRPITTVEGRVPLPSVRMFVVAPDKRGYAPFCSLAASVHPDKGILSALTHILIANGALADETSDERYRPLFWAVTSDNVQIAKILVQNGAGSTLGISTGGYRTDDKRFASVSVPVMEAALMHRVEMLRLLLSNLSIPEKDRRSEIVHDLLFHVVSCEWTFRIVRGGVYDDCDAVRCVRIILDWAMQDELDGIADQINFKGLLSAAVFYGSNHLLDPILSHPLFASWSRFASLHGITQIKSPLELSVTKLDNESFETLLRFDQASPKELAEGMLCLPRYWEGPQEPMYFVDRIIEELASRYGIDLNTRKKEGLSCGQEFATGVILNYSESVPVLGRFREIEPRLLTDQWAGEELAHTAAAFGCDKALGFLLSVGWIIDCTRQPTLHYLASGESPNSMECLRVLLEEGVDAFVVDSDGNTPLHFAAMSGNLDAALYLIDSLPNPNRKSSFVRATNAKARTALFLAGHRFMDILFSKEVASRYNSTDFRDLILRLGEYDQESHPHLVMGLKTRQIHKMTIQKTSERIDIDPGNGK
jgi:ankyrin repeat protein